MSDLTERLRDNAREWDISECPQRAEIARQAANRIEELERELKIMGGKSAHIRWAEGHGPDDPPMPATLRDKVTDAISTVLIEQPSDLMPMGERPYLERTDLAQQDFNRRTRHAEET
jgi:hypothetical protein